MTPMGTVVASDPTGEMECNSVMIICKSVKGAWKQFEIIIYIVLGLSYSEEVTIHKCELIESHKIDCNST